MIAWSRVGNIVTLGLSRATARNAIAVAGWDQLAVAITEIANSDARVVVIRSDVPGIFSAGADISEFAAMVDDPALRSRFRETMAVAIEGIAALPMPTIAAIDGGCFGAAVALVLACDVRVAGRAAMFATTPAKLGLGYPRGDVARLVAQVGRGQAARMLFAADAIDADEALRIGLVEMIADSAHDEATALADRIAANRAGAVRLLKRTIASPGDASLDAAFEARFGDPEVASGIAAFGARERGRG